MAEFTARQLAQALGQSIGESGATAARTDAYPQDFADAAVAELFALAHPDQANVRRIDSKLFDKDTLFAVPDDALNLVPALVQAVLGAFAKGPAAALPDLFGVLFRYRQLRVEITPQEAAVLRTLKEAKAGKLGPLSPAEIVDRLQADGLAAAVDVPAVLDALLAKKTEKATLVATANGRWSIGNV